MSTKLEPKPAPTDNGSDDPGIFHTTCCDDNKALCGEDVTGYAYNDGVGDQRCVVCDDLNKDHIPCTPNCDF